MHVYNLDTLRDHSGTLLKEAEAGHLALVTHDGRALFVSVPFDEAMLTTGVHLALAVKLYQSHELSLGKAAELAQMPKLKFIEYVSRLGIPVVDYPAEELEQELAGFDS